MPESGFQELLDCNLEAVCAAFIPEDLKQRLARRLTTAYAGSAGGA